MPVHPNRGAIGRAAVIAGVVALLLGACVPTQPIAVVTPSATPAPVFATDAEALAAAEKAYAAYLGMSDLIAKEGGRDPERIAPFVTEEQLVEELEGFASLAVGGFRTTGYSTSFGAVLQNQYQSGGSYIVVIYACSDVRQVKVISADENVSRDNSEVVPFPIELEFVSDLNEETNRGDLQLNRAEPIEAQIQC